MGVGDILRIAAILTGFSLLGITVSSLARRKMTESFCLTWGLISIMFILAGILLRPYGVSQFVGYTGLWLILIVGFCAVFGAFFVSTKVSELIRKNQELAIQVTLLNQENRLVMEKLEELTKELKEKQ